MAKTANDFNRSTKGEVGPNADRNAQSGFSDAALDAMSPPISDDGQGPPDIDEVHSQVEFEKGLRGDFPGTPQK